jgi:hypothetical protein
MRQRRHLAPRVTGLSFLHDERGGVLHERAVGPGIDPDVALTELNIDLLSPQRFLF